MWVIGLSTLHGIERYLGFDSLASWNPAYAFFMKSTSHLFHLRFNGHYGTKEMAHERQIPPHFRHPLFSHTLTTPSGKQYCDNKISYPLDPVAAFVQWCYPSPSRLNLEHNTRRTDLMGQICLGCDEERIKYFSFIVNFINFLYENDCSSSEKEMFQSVWMINLSPDHLMKETLFDILFDAVHLLKSDERPSYYERTLVQTIFVCYLTDAVLERSLIEKIFVTARLPVVHDQNSLQDVALDVTCDDRHPISLRTLLLKEYLKNQAEKQLPPYVSDEKINVVLDGRTYTFTDCAETSFLNFCLSFLWNGEKLNIEQWVPLKEKYKKFKPFILFFERYQTISQIMRHRTEWASLMAHHGNDRFSPLYKQDNKIELYGGHHSFLALLSNLFEEDLVLSERFVSPNVSCNHAVDRELAELKWQKLIDILNNNYFDVQLLTQSCDFSNNMVIYFSKNLCRFRLLLLDEHFSLRAVTEKEEQKFSLDDPLHLEHCYALSQRVKAKEEYAAHYKLFEDALVVTQDVPRDFQLTLALRQFVTHRLYAGDSCRDPLYLINIIETIFSNTDSTTALIHFLNHPCSIHILSHFILLDKAFLYEDFYHLDEKIFRPIQHILASTSTQCQKSKTYLSQFFHSLSQSNIESRHHILAYFNFVHYFKKIKKRPHHPDYPLLFCENTVTYYDHPLYLARLGRAKDVIACFTEKSLF